MIGENQKHVEIVNSEVQVVIEVKDYLEDLWVKDFLANESNVNKEVDVYLLLKWIKLKICLAENSHKASVDKVYIKLATEDDFDKILALTQELKRILSGDCENKTIKDTELRKETFSSEEPYWPKKWFIDITCTPPISPKVWELPQIETLTLSPDRTEFPIISHKCIPPHIGHLINLKNLIISFNHIEAFPSSLVFCEKLETIIMNNNNFKHLPGFLLNLPNLRFLSRDWNYLNCDIKPEMFCWTDIEEGQDTDKENKDERGDTKFALNNLLEQSLSAVCSNLKNLNEIKTLDVPKSLKQLLNIKFKDLVVCDQCKQYHETKKGYHYSFVIKSFQGYSYIPIRGFCCSFLCITPKINSIKTVFANNMFGYDGEVTYVNYNKPIRRPWNGIEITLDLPPCFNKYWRCKKYMSSLVFNLCQVIKFSIIPNGNFKEVPYGIGLYKHLKTLNLETLGVNMLPCDIQFCKSIEEIKLNGNEFTTLPGFFLNLPKLRSITRRNNNLIVNPPDKTIWKDTQLTDDVSSTPESLYHQALVILCLNNSVEELIKNKINMAKNYRTSVYNTLHKFFICDNCMKGMNKKTAFKYSFILTSFCDCTHIPFSGNCCSLQCANDFVDAVKLKYTLHEKIHIIEEGLGELPKCCRTAELFCQDKRQKCSLISCWPCR